MIGVIPVIISAMSVPGVDVTWSIESCGEVNAAYFPASHRIVVCQELIEGLPLSVPEVVAHEMAHAIIDQLQLPLGGMTNEDAADSLSAVFMAKYDPQALIDAGFAFYNLGGDGDGDHSPTRDRGNYFVCMSDGGEDDPANPVCKALYKTSRAYWSAAIMLAEVAREP